MRLSPVLTGAAGLCLSLLWVTLATAILASLRRVRRLSEVLEGDEADAAGAARPDSPGVTVVVTARDEARRIEATVRGLMEQDAPGLEVVVVDDRSSDGTREILSRLATEAARRQEGPRLRIVRVDHLPTGWLGKVHACREGARAATGAFILFMDADVTFSRPDLLGRVVALAERRRLDHVALVPDSRPMSAPQAGLLGLFGQVYLTATLAFEMERDRRRGGGGIGAFNLVRRAAYDRIGGHDLLRMDIADDFKLGRLLKESGARQRFYDATDLVRCRWHEGAWNVVRGLEKNYFASLDFSLWKLCAFTVAGLAATFGPLALALWGSGAWRFPALPIQIAALLAMARRQAPGLGAHPAVLALLHPLSALLLLTAAWNSALKTLARGGVRWRETFYPIAELRRGLVPPGAGRRLG